MKAADAYFRESAKMALAICTSGPGATNFVTGIYTANVDSILIIAIIGQSALPYLDRILFRMWIMRAFASRSLKPIWCVTHTEDIPKNRSLAVMGDLGFTSMGEELAVCTANNVPVIVVIVNNAYLSLIRQNQKYAYQYEYAVSM